MKNELNTILTETKDLIKGEVSEITYRTWISPLEILSIQDNNITLIADDPFKKDYAETKFKDLIKNAFDIVLHKNCNINIILKDEQVVQQTVPNFVANINYSKSGLKSNCTFSSFVVGDSNRFAHATALAVAESPGTAYNPLFIYGGVGLGKTHLMHAIGNEILRKNKNAKILYITSEALMNEFIDALTNNAMQKFRQKYRNNDVLLLDDVQFIAGKDRLQEEFFHTFNELKENEKQIVLTSDKPPKDIPLLEDRLKSRLEWGILADIGMPDYEMRLAILRKKTQEKHLIIDDDILQDIAVKIDSNIRELEGVFNKLVAQSSLTHTPITIEMTERAINDVIKQKDSVISIEYIQECVCNYFSVSLKDLTSSLRSNNISFPRQVGMYLCRILTNESFPKLGDAFGKRDHTTVMHAFKKIEKDIKEDNNTKLIVESVKKIILNGK